MNLDEDGKKRLAAMKAALAGLPLTGLLVGTAGCSGNGGHVMGRFPDPQAPVEQPAPVKDDADATMGDIPPPECPGERAGKREIRLPRTGRGDGLAALATAAFGGTRGKVQLRLLVPLRHVARAGEWGGLRSCWREESLPPLTMCDFPCVVA